MAMQEANALADEESPQTVGRAVLSSLAIERGMGKIKERAGGICVSIKEDICDAAYFGKPGAILKQKRSFTKVLI